MNEKKIKEQFEQKIFAAITLKYSSKHKKHRCELVTRGNYQPCRRILKEKLETKVIMVCRTETAVEFRNRLVFNQHDPIMTKEQSVLTKI